MQVSYKTPAERLVHALTFELIAMLICAPLFSWLMDLPLAEMGVMTLMLPRWQWYGTWCSTPSSNAWSVATGFRAP